MIRELLRSTPVSSLAVAAILLPHCEACPAPQDAGAPAGLEVPFPVIETITSGGEVDPRQLLSRVVEEMGGERLDQLETISFARNSWHWQGAQLRFYEKLTTHAYLKDRFAGRVNDACINTAGGKSQEAAYVVNGDDRFKLLGTNVFASLADEVESGKVLQSELFLALAPWFVERAGAELTYAGLATIKTFNPRLSAPADADGLGGHSDYKPAVYKCHKVVGSIPEKFREACGEEIVFWFAEDSGKLLRFRCSVFSSFGLYRDVVPIFEVDGYQEFDGVRLPKTLYVTTRGNAERVEDVKFSDVQLDPKIEDKRLKRP